MIGTPSDPNRPRQKDFPVAMPPVSATRSMAHAPGSRDWAAATVFLRSIAIVSGPTPPGTGVSAPATSATPGCTSPTTMDPRRSKSASRGEPGSNRRRTTSRVGHRGRADVHHRRARLHERSRDEAGTADRGHQDVGSRRHRREVRCFRMADRHRRVPLQQQHRHRLPDNLAAADHHRVRTRHRDAAPDEQLDDAGRRARHEARAPLHEPADVGRMEAVHVLVGIDRVEHALRGAPAHRRGQRRLHEDAVVLGAGVQPRHERQQLVERRGRRQALQVHPEPGLGAGAHLVPHVDFRRRDRRRRARCRGPAAVRHGR